MNKHPQTHAVIRQAAYRLGHTMADVLPPIHTGKEDVKAATLCHALLSCAVEVLRDLPAGSAPMPVTFASINGSLDHMLTLLQSWLASGQFVPAGTEQDDEAANLLARIIGEDAIFSSIVGGSDTLALALMDTAMQATQEPCLFLYAEGFRGDNCPLRACALLMEPCHTAALLPTSFEDIIAAAC